MSSACGCEGAGLRATARQDIDRYVYYLEVDGRTGPMAWFNIALLSPGLWAILAYRLAHHAAQVRRKPLRAMASGLAAVIQQAVTSLTDITIDARAHVGPGLMIPHGGYIVIGPARLGAHCDVLQGVTIGVADAGSTVAQPCPQIGDRVWIGPGAAVAGEVQIGSDASLGANGLIARDVPPGGVMLGVPARLISRNGSWAQVRYRGLRDDPDRLAALTSAGLEDPADPALHPSTRQNAS